MRVDGRNAARSNSPRRPRSLSRSAPPHNESDTLGEIMAYREFVSLVHKSTKRDYLARVTQRDKADVAEMAIKFDYDYWDGSRETGYGGYKYDGRWRKVADAMIAAYGIKPGMRVLDVGSGKGFLLHDFREAIPDIEIAGIDISAYGIEHTMADVKPFCQVGSATKLPWPDKHFDLVVSITTLHNLYNYDLDAALREMERVSRGAKYLCVEAYRNEREKVNLMYWQLTCRIFHTPEEWAFDFKRSGYSGDHEFIFFE
jgi:protein-L-isoaspartate(D-aspartate) O-methyltransferase